jgi:aspartyl-tRNA(Asn)/glutamyl-tRNA(Gln) amidotransferase subunit B
MPVVIDDEWFDSIQASLPEFPEVKRERYINEIGLSEYDADQLVKSIAICECFEDAYSVCGSAKDSAKHRV